MKHLLLITLINQAFFLSASLVAPEYLAIKDYIQIEANGRLDSLKAEWHAVNLCIRFIMFVPLAMVAIFPAFMVVKSFAGIVSSILVLLTSLALNAAIHWKLFDLHLNKLRGKDPAYIGQNAKSDLFLHKHPKAKLYSLIATICFYLVSLVSLIYCL